ncbi:MAG: HAD family phosphatase [Lacrimispora sp.]
MIKNIVFDMGRVLLNYEGDMVCRHLIRDEAKQRAVASAVFDSQEWILLDMGLISEDDALKRMQRRLDTDYEKEMAALCLAHWHEYNMWPIDGMEELVARLKEEGYGIYLLSNASLRLLDCYQMIPGIQHFDGVLFSAEVKYIKPQKEIYFHLFDRYHLKPEECLFIDDLSVNVEGAIACGMDGYCFADGDVGRLEEFLSHLNEG